MPDDGRVNFLFFFPPLFPPDRIFQFYTFGQSGYARLLALLATTPSSRCVAGI